MHHHLQFQSTHAFFCSEATVALPPSSSLATSLVFGASARQVPVSRLTQFSAKVRWELPQYFMIHKCKSLAPVQRMHTSYEILHMFVHVGSADVGLVHCLIEYAVFTLMCIKPLCRTDCAYAVELPTEISSRNPGVVVIQVSYVEEIVPQFV